MQFLPWFVLCVTSLREHEDISWDAEGLFVTDASLTQAVVCITALGVTL